MFSIKTTTVPANEQRMIGTGIAIALPPGTYARIAPRSGLAFKHGITTNAGVIDADYRGEVKVLLVNLKETDYEVKEGDRIAQIIIERIYDKDFKEVKYLDDTERSTSGFGSTEHKEQERKKEPDIELVSARAFGKMYKRGDRAGIFNLRTAEKRATCAAMTISTELAIKAGKGGDKISLKQRVPGYYHEILDIFEEGERQDLPPHRERDHAIELEQGQTALFKPLYPLDEEKLKALNEYLRKNLDRGWIRASSSSAGAPILFANKKDGGLRLCVDYRGLNAVTKKDRYPLPLISEAIDRRQTAKYFTKLDIKDAYHNIRVRHGDEWKTAFWTRYGLFKYTVMPFGLTNTPAMFQRWINRILSQELDVCCIAYLDDMLIYSDTLEQHQKDVLRIMKRLKEAGIKLKPTKCEFHKKETEYLGIIIGPEGTKVDPVKTEAIKE